MQKIQKWQEKASRRAELVMAFGGGGGVSACVPTFSFMIIICLSKYSSCFLS